jgi:ubiquinol-cytochrome c reductase cytochrome b subunit
MAVILILGYLGAQTADDSNVIIPWTGVELPIGKLLLSQICTAYYFLHFFLITPAIGLWETPDPVPESISKAVLAKKGGSVAPAAAA